MSSNSTGRYQSKFLNFITQQVQRWGERHDRAIRNLKVASVWSAQVLLYPIYALFQTARLAGKQLNPSVEPESRQLPESASPPQKEVPPPDTHIQQVLEIARSIARPEKFVNAIATAAESASNGDQMVIRGVACQIATKTLVLTGDRGEVLDILTPPLQQQLQRRILAEEASYWSHRHRAIAPSPADTPTLPPTDTRTNIWQPVRVFLNIMTWMQIGPVALAVNLFQEAAIALQPREQESQVEAAAGASFPALPRLKQVSGKLETPPSPHLPIPAPLSSPSPRDLLQQVQNFGVALVSDAPGTAQPPSDRPDTFGIQSLIKAAVDYFFAETGEKLPAAAELDAEPDPWLAAGELFGTRSNPLKISAAEPAPSVLSLPSSSLPDVPVKQSLRTTVAREAPREAPLSRRESRRESLKQPTPKAAIAQTPKSVKKSQKIAPQKIADSPSAPAAAPKPTHTAATAQIPPASTNLQATPHGSDVEHTPDWIEAKAYSTGYVKHPLEVVLEWVDTALLWFEKLIVEFLRWVQQAMGSRV